MKAPKFKTKSISLTKQPIQQGTEIIVATSGEIDWEDIATKAGWTGPHKDRFGATYFKDETDGQTWACGSWKELCLEFVIGPGDLP